ncbi:MAG: hypothetical protein Q8N03_06575 [Ignavibacteria bacterium]|nr:hypothetical protein [Ignavibacteria bacterium]MDP3831510.1 hypothetical protein [Ignavibacteriaceae bacterium]
MTKKNEYIFDEVTAIMYKNYFGEITLEDISSSWDYVFEHNLIPKGTKRFILNYKQASFNIRISEYPGIAEYYRNHLDVFEGCRIGIVTNVNKDYVIPVMVEKLDEGYGSRPFGDLEDAVEWVVGV